MARRGHSPAGNCAQSHWWRTGPSSISGGVAYDRKKEVLWRNARSAETSTTRVSKFESAAAHTYSIASNARFTPSRRHALIADARSSAMASRRTGECIVVRIAHIKRGSETSAIAHNQGAPGIIEETHEP